MRRWNTIGSPVGLVLASGTLLVSCAAAPRYQRSETVSSPTMDAAAEAIAPDRNDGGLPAGTLAEVTTVPRSLPQLVKQAELTLTVKSIEDSLAAINSIVRQYQGDLLSLNATRPQDEQQPRRAYLEVRVPQGQLERAIADLVDLGVVEQQQLSAQDVSAQLVDYDARLRNLRKSEELVLGIMERSGDMGEVLTVARELDTIRAAIEQLDAQINSLRNQVAYSTIRLTLQTEGIIASSRPTPGTQLGRTWQQARVAVGDVTVNLVQLLIWLLVFSPYWLSGLGLLWLAKCWLARTIWQRPSRATIPPAQD
jgi:hypothetical protein